MKKRNKKLEQEEVDRKQIKTENKMRKEFEK